MTEPTEVAGKNDTRAMENLENPESIFNFPPNFLVVQPPLMSKPFTISIMLIVLQCIIWSHL